MLLYQIKNISGKIPVKLHPLLFWGTLIIILAAGVGALVYATPYGPGLINDSVVYIGGAENILAGNGYSRTSGGGEIKPLTVNVPLYSYTLAAAAKTGLDLIKAGWLISLASFVLNGLLTMLIGLRMTGSRIWALSAVILVISSDSVIQAHTFALSEPLFMVLMFLSVLLLSYALERDSWYFPVVSGIMVSLTYLTRYIGLSLLATGVVAFFVFSTNWKDRFTKIGLFLTAGLLGGIGWFIRNIQVSGSAANRSLLYHPLTIDKLQEGTRTLLAFLFPNRLNLHQAAPILWDGFAVLMILGKIVMVYLIWRGFRLSPKITGSSRIQTAFLVTLQSVFYLVVLFLSLTFLDASTALENRILVPVFVCIILVFIYLANLLWTSKTSWVRWMAAIVTLLAILANLYDGRRAVIDLHADGQGYASAYYRNSLTIDALKRMPPATIWTNRVPAVNLLADRPAYALLAPIDPLTRQKRPNYDSSLQGIRQSVLNGKAILVVFEARQVLDDPIEGQWLKDLTQDIPEVFDSEDGMIFAVKK
jgi:4-amino-4-deoxy-L-arabinose transferase-like glycosyltransferase